MLKNLLQNQQNLKARGIYSCTGIYFFKSADSFVLFLVLVNHLDKIYQTKNFNRIFPDEATLFPNFLLYGCFACKWFSILYNAFLEI